MRKKTVLMIVLILVLILVCICLYTNRVYKSVTKNVMSLQIDAVSFHSYSDHEDINNVRDPDVIERIKEYLSVVSFGGFITESGIKRTEDNDICLLSIACKDGPSYEIQLTSDEIDQCYIRTLKGLFSDAVYIKISNCTELYNWVLDYIADGAY